MRKRERDYVRDLEQTTEQLKKLLETKTAEIEKNKNDVIAQVKQTSGKLKFTLKGSVARDQEFLQMALSASRDRLAALETLVDKADELFLKAALDECEVNVSIHYSTVSATHGCHILDLTASIDLFSTLLKPDVMLTLYNYMLQVHVKIIEEFII